MMTRIIDCQVAKFDSEVLPLAGEELEAQPRPGEPESPRLERASGNPTLWIFFGALRYPRDIHGQLLKKVYVMDI